MGESKFAFKFNAVWVAVETGFNASVVLSTLVNPTIAFVIPFTVPVKVGESKFALRPNDVSTMYLYVEIAPLTNVVLASCNVLTPADAVGAKMLPQISTLPAKDASLDTESLPFVDKSLVITTL